MQYRLRTLLILLAVLPPLLAGASFGLWSAETRPMTLNILTFAACGSAVIAWLWLVLPPIP
jgi:hypothetical protein